MEDQKLAALSDEELLRRVAAVVSQSRRSEAEIVAHLAELDARRLHALLAFPSLHAYCTLALHFSDAEAYLRISAARASREHPILLSMLADGRLHLSAIERLAPHLTAENRDILLARATHKSKRQVEELLAELRPRADAPALIRKLPERHAARQVRGAPDAGHSEAHALAHAGSLPGTSGNLDVAPRSTAPAISAALAPSSPPEAPKPATDGALPELRPNGAAASAARTVTVARQELIEPTAPGRYKVQFTASAELREKLERLRELMGVSGADLASVIEQAVSEKLERLEARRFGLSRRGRLTSPGAAARGSRPAPAPNGVDAGAYRQPALSPEAVRANAATGPTAQGNSAAIGQLTGDTTSIAGEVERPAPASGSSVRRLPRHIPAAVRRAVYLRDGGRCTYTDTTGRRCGSRRGIEIHHDHPYGYGGDHDARGLRLRCWSHHRLSTEADYGARPESPKTREGLTLR